MFLVAKKYHQYECIVHEEKDESRAYKFAEELTKKAFPLGVQILTARDITTYNEYQSYELIEDEDEFVKRVLSM